MACASAFVLSFTAAGTTRSASRANVTPPKAGHIFILILENESYARSFGASSPAPYLARAKWISLESPDALPDAEFTQLLRESYELVLAKLPRKMRESIGKRPAAKARTRNKPPAKIKKKKVK